MLDSLMRSLIIVEGDIFLQNPLDLTSANQQIIAQCLSSHGSKESFHDTVHIGRFHSGSDGDKVLRKIVDIEHQRIVSALEVRRKCFPE